MAAIWNFPTRIVFGLGESQRTGEEAASLGIQRALLVTDTGVVSAGLTDGVLTSLSRSGIKVHTFAGVDSNPTEQNIEDGANAYAAHRADGVIALGGGSPIDAAKLIALRARTDRPFEELDDAVGGGRYVPSDVPPLVALPTTAGTGSEVGRSGVLTLRSSHRKTVIFSPHLLAKVAILDPELTRSMPPRTTAATGFDALTHCIESYLARGDHPMADAIALSGIDLIAKHLPLAVTDGNNLEARGAMMKAAMMGAVAFQKGLGACHSLAHPLSSECGLHHGLANALCLPAVLRFNQRGAIERVLHVGLLVGADAREGACAEAVLAFRTELGLPAGLRAVGVDPSLLPRLADLAFEDACHRENPVPCTRDDLLGLYQAAL
ncbi:MAG TPA: iron-containing alcohol dehydrogenase [Polyangiaceae bacterium]|jgi:alcohol dehydrogenase class IV